MPTSPDLCQFFCFLVVRIAILIRRCLLFASRSLVLVPTGQKHPAEELGRRQKLQRRQEFNSLYWRRNGHDDGYHSKDTSRSETRTDGGRKRTGFRQIRIRRSSKGSYLTISH